MDPNERRTRVRFDRTRDRRESRRVEGRSSRVFGRRCRIAQRSTLGQKEGYEKGRREEGGAAVSFEGGGSSTSSPLATTTYQGKESEYILLRFNLTQFIFQQTCPKKEAPETLLLS